MSDLPSPPEDGGEELDLGEVEEEGADGAEGDAADGDEAGADAEGDGDEEEEGQGRNDVAAGGNAAGRQGRKSQAQRWRERAERAERQLQDSQPPGWFQQYLQGQQQPRGPDPAEIARQQREEQDRLAMMSPQEVAAYYYQKGQQQIQQAMLMQSLQFEDRIDKRAYDDQARASRFHQQHGAEVERRLQAERNSGNLRATRAGILAQIVGEQAMARAAAAAPQQRRAAQRRVAGQQTRPGGARGDSVGRGRAAPGTPEHDDALIEEFFANGGRL